MPSQQHRDRSKEFSLVLGREEALPIIQRIGHMEQAAMTTKKSAESNESGVLSNEDFSRPAPLILKTVRRLLSDILAGTYGPGDRIREAEVAIRLGISRAPVREALRVLEQDGLIELMPWRGARVCKLEPEQMTDLFDLLGTVYGAVARFAVRHASAEDLDKIYAHVRLYAQWLGEGRPFNELLDLAYRMGTDLGQICGNPLAAAMMRKLGRQAYVLHRYLSPPPARWLQQGLTRLRRLESALRARSEVRAEKAARRMIHHTQTLVLKRARSEEQPALEPTSRRVTAAPPNALLMEP